MLGVSGILTVSLLSLICASFGFSDALAFTADEIELKLEERTELQQKVAQLKEDMLTNQQEIDRLTQQIAESRSEVRVLKQAGADDDRVFALENSLASDTVRVRDLKVDRIDLLRENSETLQRINVLNDEVRYNVEGLETEVKIVSSENINLQINIEELEKQSKLLDEIEKSIEEESKINDQQIKDYQFILSKYKLEAAKIKDESLKSWSSISGIEGAEQLVINMESIIDVFENHKEDLANDMQRLEQERRTIQQVLEESNQQLEQNNFDKSKLKKLVGVKLSKSCIVLIKNNFPTNCPTYEDLYPLDSSETRISGKFVYDEKGFFHRDTPNFQNSIRWYDNDDEIRLIIDPPPHTAERIRMITIENNFGEYFKADDRTVGDDRLRKYHEGRYISKCFNATVSADRWGELLTDTINMLRTGCESTTIQDRFVEALPVTDTDISTSPNWQYQQWLNNSIASCKTICKQY